VSKIPIVGVGAYESVLQGHIYCNITSFGKHYGHTNYHLGPFL